MLTSLLVSLQFVFVKTEIIFSRSFSRNLPPLHCVLKYVANWNPPSRHHHVSTPICLSAPLHRALRQHICLAPGTKMHPNCLIIKLSTKLAGIFCHLVSTPICPSPPFHPQCTARCTEIICQQQDCKPRSYDSLKLRPTDPVTDRVSWSC